MKYALHIGRWQPPHLGHKWLWDTALANGKNLLIAIRDVPPDENQPLTAEQVKALIDKIYFRNERVKAIIIPDIESVNYGRGVGYEVIEHKPDPSIGRISATEIRNKIRSNDSTWKEMVDPSIQTEIEELLK